MKGRFCLLALPATLFKAGLANAVCAGGAGVCGRSLCLLFWGKCKLRGAARLCRARLPCHCERVPSTSAAIYKFYGLPRKNLLTRVFARNDEMAGVARCAVWLATLAFWAGVWLARAACSAGGAVCLCATPCHTERMRSISLNL